MAASGWEAGGRELKRMEQLAVERQVIPGLPALHLEREGVSQNTAIAQGVTPIGKFAVVLLLFALAVFFLPKGVRGWFVIIILLGALTVNPGAIKEFQQWTGV